LQHAAGELMPLGKPASGTVAEPTLANNPSPVSEPPR
jgi:hypothetical protein